MTERDESFIVAEITVRLTSTPDGDIQHSVHIEGDPTLLQQLGMLELAKDTCINSETES